MIISGSALKMTVVSAASGGLRMRIAVMNNHCQSPRRRGHRLRRRAGAGAGGGASEEFFGVETLMTFVGVEFVAVRAPPGGRQNYFMECAESRRERKRHLTPRSRAARVHGHTN